MKRVLSSSLALLLTVAASSLFVRASTVVVPSHTWEATGELAEARAGAAAVLLSDGVVLITGGSGPDGSSASAERYSVASGTFAPAASMLAARANHTATPLSDGRILVIGGHTAPGAVTGAAEIYDPSTNAWTPAGTLVHARAGHTATLLADGRVLVAGGENAEGALATLEVYSPVFEEFSLVAAPLTAARVKHAAALAGDKVLIIGGWDGSAALASVDVFDPANDSVSAGPAMIAPRAEHTATTLMNGDVLVAGGIGTQEEGELQSAEVFRATTGAFAATTAMASKRRNHIALLLPHNNSVLIAGGWSEGAASATAELYRSWQDGGIFVPTGASVIARNWSAGSALSFAASATNRGGPADGLVLVAGGEGTSSAELYGFATVKTDKDDYQPGDVVYVSGSGWLPNQTVTFYVRELPAEHYARLVTIEADAAGNINGAKLFDVEEHHLNVRFLLTAADGVSQAHMTFTDANPQTIGVVAPTSVTVIQGGTAVYGNATIVVGGNSNPCTVTLGTTALPTGAVAVFGTPSATTTGANIVSTLSVTTTALTPAGTYTFQVTGSKTGAGCQGTGPSPSNTLTLIVNSAAVATTTTASNATATYGDPSVTLNVQVSPAASGGTVLITIKDGPTPIGTTTSGTVAGGAATASFSLSGVNAGTYTIEAAYSGASGFNASNNSGQSPAPTLTVNKAATTTTVTCTAGPFTFNGSPHTPCSATVTGAGGLNEPVTVSYSANTNAGTATATATYAESANHLGSSDSETFTIAKAATTTTVTCPVGPYTYNGAAQTPCSATVTGAGGLNDPLTVIYSDNTNAGTATASAAYVETANYLGSSDSKTFAIGKAATTTVVTCPAGPFTYNGAAQTPCSANVSGAGGLNQSLTVTYLDNINVGTATASAAYVESANYLGSSDSETFAIGKAATTTVVTCGPGPFTYNGAAQTPCTANVTGAGGLNQSLTVSYVDNVNAGTATASASYAESANYLGSSDSETFAIGKAATTTAVTCPGGPFTYNGLAQTPCSANATGAGGLNESLTVTYLDNINAGTATASASYAESANYQGSSDSENFTIGKAATTTVVTCPAGPFTYNGAAQTPCSANVNGPGGLSESLTVSYLNNINAGPATASATYAESANYQGSTDSENFTIDKAATTTTVTCPVGPYTYNGAAHTPCSANVAGAGGLNQSLTVSYLNNINAGLATANAAYAETANYQGSADSETFTIDKAATTTLVTCGAGPFTYNGAPHTPCTAGVNGDGGLSESLTVNYSDNINAGIATASASYAESANYLGSSDSETFTIAKAATATLVTCGPGPFTFNGAPHTPCSANVTGPVGLNEALTVGYADNINAGTATASASYAESANYLGSSDSETFTIGKAASITLVTCPAGPYIYTGSAQTPCSANATGAGGLNQSLTVSYADNINAGTATASATYAESANHLGSSDSETFAIGKAATTTIVTCPAGPFTYNAAPQTPCSASVSGAGGLAQSLTVSYLDNTNAGTATANAAYIESANYLGSSDSETFAIGKAVATVTVSGYTGTYDGAAHGATGSATGVDAGGAALGATLNLGATFTNVPGGTAFWTFNGGTNYTNQSGSVLITIGKATPTVTVSFPASPIVHDGNPHPATVVVTGVGGGVLGIPANGTTAITYTRNAAPFAGVPTLVGVYTAAATFTSTNGNYNNAASTVNASLTILTACTTFNGFLSPIGGAVELATGGSLLDPVRAFKLNSTIPVKFSATCSGTQLLTGIHTLQATKYSNAGTPDAAIDATPTDAATTGNQFRLSGVEWHFNLNTKALGGGAQGIWLLEATLFDGSKYSVWVEIKK